MQKDFWISFLNFPGVQNNGSRLLLLCSLGQTYEKAAKTKTDFTNATKTHAWQTSTDWGGSVKFFTSPAEPHACKAIQGVLTALWVMQQHLGASHPSLCIEKAFFMCFSQNHPNHSTLICLGGASKPVVV